MKKVSLFFALFLGFAAASFAQGKCAMNELIYTPGEDVVRVNDIYSTDGIVDAEGSALYSVAMTVDFVNKKASRVVLTHLKNGKRWSMNQVTSVKSIYIPVKCGFGDVNGREGYAFKGTGTNMVVYFVPNPYSLDGPRVVMYLPNGPQDIQTLN